MLTLSMKQELYVYLHVSNDLTSILLIWIMSFQRGTSSVNHKYKKLPLDNL